jgi:hypothetical protein
MLVFLHQSNNFSHLLSADTVILAYFDARFKPNLCFTITGDAVYVHSLLFSRKKKNR